MYLTLSHFTLRFLLQGATEKRLSFNIIIMIGKLFLLFLLLSSSSSPSILHDAIMDKLCLVYM